MSDIRVHAVTTAAETAASQALRHAVLRRPWGQELEADSVPPTDDLIADVNGTVVATGRLFVSADGQCGQIRGMAVEPAQQGRRIGRAMLDALELRARGRGCSAVWANARGAALGFYAGAGYEDAGDGPTLFGEVPHRRVRKTIDHTDYRPWNLQLRPATDADGPELADLIFGCLAEFGMAPEQDGIDRDLEAIVDSYRGGAFWLAEDPQGTVQASVGMLPIGTDAYELRRMYLASGQRGSGLGRALLGTALHWARERQAHYIELETASALKTALHLYQWAGFSPVAGELETRRCDQRLGLQLV